MQDGTTWYLQYNGMANSDMQICVWKYDFVMNTWRLLYMKMRRETHLEERQQAGLSAEIIRVLREDHAEADKNLSSDSLHFQHSLLF